MGFRLEMIDEVLLWPSPNACPSRLNLAGNLLRDLEYFFAQNDPMHSK